MAKLPESLELFSNETDLQINVLDTTRPVAARFFDWLKNFLPIAPGPIAYQAVGHNFPHQPRRLFSGQPLPHRKAC